MEGWQYSIGKKAQWREIPWCSAALTGINILVFGACHFWGDTLYDEGAFSVLYMLKGHDYYRLITSLFLHADIGHLANNMILLYFGGEIVEKTMGKARFLLLFFVSGICGNLLSAVYEMTAGGYYDSIGASGAVFGLIGGLLYLVIMGKGRAWQISVQRMVLMIALTLYSGFRSVRVNSAAHIGGLLSGFLLAFLLCNIGHIPDRKS